MKVLLLKDVVKVGQRGEVVEVKDGFGRNYLIRQGLARLADIGSIRRVEAKKAAQLERETAKKAATDIIAILHKDGYDFVRENDLGGFPLKTTGEHEVSLKIGDGEEIPIHIHIKPL